MTPDFKTLASPELSTDAQRAAETLRELRPDLEDAPKPSSLMQSLITYTLLPILVVKNLLLANPEEFHGKYYVTPELEEHSRLTARVISVGSLFNAITNQPLLFFAFKEFGNLPAIAFSLILNLLIVKFTNDNGTAVAGRKYGNRAWARAGASAMIAMSVLQSLAAGVGMEATNNRPELARLKATEAIERQTQNLAEMPTTTAESEAARREYELTLGEYQNTSKDDANWDTLYVRLYGRWEDRDRNWSQVPTENLPLEQRMLRLEREAAQSKQAAQQAWTDKLAQRQQIGDDVLFLEQEMPQLFARHFDENYELRSGTETIRLAALNLYRKLAEADIAGLGFPLFFFLLSVVTSGAACWLTLAHAQREDVAMSRDEAVIEAINAYLDRLIQNADDDAPEAS